MQDTVEKIGGATVDSTSEANINLKITLKVQKLLEQAGSTVILTRSDENGIYDLDKNTLKEKKVSIQVILFLISLK